MAMAMATSSTHLQLIMLLSLVLSCFLVFLQVSRSEKTTTVGSNGSWVNVSLQNSNGSEINVASRSMLMLEARSGSTQINGTSGSTLIPKATKSCRAMQGLCSSVCLTGCCNERCSKRFKNGAGKCLEPILPTAPCFCQYSC